MEGDDGMRHAGVLSALLLTAALLCAMPGLARLPAQQSRADESLQPARLRTLTVWLLPGDVDDRRLLSRLCADFEKERDGVRVFLRVITADELTAENAVLPDAVLFETGDIAMPEKALLPLADVSDSSGMFAGVQRAVPLWLAPNVLSIPQKWLQEDAAATPRPDSLLAASTAAPEQETNRLIDPDELPWGMLTQPGAIAAPQGVGWQQLLASCPHELRAGLVSAVLGMGAQTLAPAEVHSASAPIARGASPTPMPAIDTPARVETLAQHQTRLKKGEALAAYVLTPAVSHRVRYAALCRDGEDARAFVQFLLRRRADAPAYGLIAPGCEAPSPDPLTSALADAYRAAVLPNAFAHTRQELLQLCAQGFARCDDPVGTLLRLR